MAALSSIYGGTTASLRFPGTISCPIESLDVPDLSSFIDGAKEWVGGRSEGKLCHTGTRKRKFTFTELGFILHGDYEKSGGFSRISRDKYFVLDEKGSWHFYPVVCKRASVTKKNTTPQARKIVADARLPSGVSLCMRTIQKISYLSKGRFLRHILVYPEMDHSLESFKASSIDELKTVIFKMLDCLKELHAFELVHFDIKPDNFLLKRTPEGIKVLLDDLEFVTSVGKLVDKVGTRQYRAPEFIDQWSLGRRCRATVGFDIYSLGQTIGELVYQAEIDSELKDQIFDFLEKEVVIPDSSERLKSVADVEQRLRTLLKKGK